LLLLCVPGRREGEDARQEAVGGHPLAAALLSRSEVGFDDPEPGVYPTEKPTVATLKRAIGALPSLLKLSDAN
jgi:hypothetical protein